MIGFHILAVKHISVETGSHNKKMKPVYLKK